MLPRVSVIIPVYNAGPYLEDTLRSVLAQTLPPVEILAIDDGSTDRTALILAAHQARGVTVLHHPQRINRGMSESRNLGVRHATGEHLAFLDADDRWHPDTLRQLAQAMHTSGAGVAVAHVRAIDPQGQPLYTFPLPTLPADQTALRRALFLDNSIQCPSQVLIRRALFDQVGGFDSTWGDRYPGVEDVDLWIRLAAVTPFALVPEPLVDYRRHPQQASTANARRMWQQAMRYVAASSARGVPLEWRRKRAAVVSYRLAQCDRADGRPLRAIARLAAAAALDPRRALAHLATAPTTGESRCLNLSGT